MSATACAAASRGSVCSAPASRREIEIKRLPRASKLALVGRNGVLPESEKK